MNLRPLLSQLSVVTKDAQLVPLSMNREQDLFVDEVERQANNRLPIRIITLKARQMGISTITEAIMFLFAMLFTRYKGMVIAHEIDSAQHLLGMTTNYWETYPYKKLWTPKYQSRNELAWVESNSSMKIATANNIKAGRSRTIQALHASEIAFYEDPKTLMTGLRQSIPNKPNTFIHLESTANGVGNYFYETWMAAVAGDVDYVPLFFPWQNFPDYCASANNLPYKSLGNLDGEERILRKLGINDDRLAWRRWAIKNLCNNDLKQFHQEYPTTPEEAFVATGTNVFPVSKLADCYKHMEGQVGRLTRDGNTVRFQPDIDGPLRVFRTPSKDTDWGQYFVAGDPTKTTRGDYACAQVISRRTLEQVAVYRQRIDPSSFAEELAKLGKFYNTAMISTEKEGPGYATIGALIEKDYPSIWYNRTADVTPGMVSERMGWSTTMKTKELAIGWLLKVVVDKDILIHDRQTFMEMRDYISLPNGGYGNAGNEDHDDTVMSLAIAVTCHSMEGPLMPYEGNGNAPVKSVPWESWDQQMEGVG